VLYGGDHLANRLSPLFAAAGKLLIITNAGANYPLVSVAGSPVLFHSLHDSLCAFLTGKLCGAAGDKNAIMATSFYDGGYQHAHAISNGFTLGGGEIKFNFVSHFKKEMFSAESLAMFIKNNPGVKKLLAVFCGDMARCFYEKLAPLQQEFNLQLYGSPMMFDCTPGDFAETKPFVKQIKGYTGWVPEIDNAANREFKTFYQKENKKEANLFSFQGWEQALLLKEYFQQIESAGNITAAMALLKSKPFTSPRGMISINDKQWLLGPVHLVHAVNNLEITVEDTITDISTAWEEMMAQIPDSEFSNWRNTYLCI
jgi:branched-chain amino acid transport system substrate-binding protein